LSEMQPEALHLKEPISDVGLDSPTTESAHSVLLPMETHRRLTASCPHPEAPSSAYLGFRVPPTRRPPLSRLPFGCI
jgi:hypothetical protein